MKHRNEQTGGAYPEDLLETCLDPIVLERCLAYFVVEVTRNTKGEPYKPDTIYQILCGLLHYMRSIHGGKKVPNFLNKKNQGFRRLHAVTDRHYRKLREVGIGGRRQHAEVVTPEEENQLWTTRVLGVHSPTSLQNAVFYYNGKTFALRGIGEQYRLEVSQLVREYSPDRYVYTENRSKNRSGGIGDFNVPNKIVLVYSNPAAGVRCHVFLVLVRVCNLGFLAV